MNDFFSGCSSVFLICVFSSGSTMISSFCFSSEFSFSICGGTTESLTLDLLLPPPELPEELVGVIDCDISSPKIP